MIKNTGLLFVYSLSFIASSFGCVNEKISKVMMRDKDPILTSSQIDYDNLLILKHDLLSKLFHDESAITAIEYANYIDVVNEDFEVLYIDFSGDNGFLVLNDETDEIYEFNDHGDLVELRHASNYHYSIHDSFVVFDEVKNIYEKIYDANFEDVICTNDEILSSPEIHGGQDREGDGQIYDLNAYVSSRYPGYTYVQSKYIRNYRVVYQTDNSVYVENTYNSAGYATGGYRSEGNCVINYTFSMLSNLPTLENQYGYCWRYNENYLAAYSPINYSTAVYADSQYSNYGMHNYIKTWYDDDEHDYFSSYWEINNHYNSRYNRAINDLPTLYMQLRTVAISNGYNPTDGMNFSKTKTMVENTDHFYSYDLQLNLSASTDSVISNINYNIPSLISTSGSETFGNHAMTVYGYAKYSYQKQILWWQETHYAYFWMVDSGWWPNNESLFYDSEGNRINWFDPNQCSVSFAVLNRNKLTWPTC